MQMGKLMAWIWVAAGGLCLAAPGGAPSVDELLAQYRQTREKCLHSFAAKSGYTMDTNWKRAPQIKPGRYLMYKQSDFRYDGRRVRSRSRSWGDLGGSAILPQDDPMRNSNILELEWRANYSGRQGQPGAIKYYREPLNPELAKRYVASEWAGACGFGFFSSDEPVDLLIRRSGKATVRGQTEMINGSACYVIDAPAEEGQLTVWFDPAHGYHIAKAMMVQKEGDKVHGQVLPRGHREQRILTNLSFRQVSGVWVPMESTYAADILHPPDHIMTGTTHCRITEFLIDPDHEALKSFEVNDFPEGTRTSYTDNGRLLPVWYIWKNGRPVPDTEKTRARVP
jgi:hypothetical protein